MSITPTMQSRINGLSLVVQSLGAAVATQENISKMFVLLDKFRQRPELYEEYQQNPEQVVLREVGPIGAAGTHLHTVDEHNQYSPAEGGAEAQIMEGRAAPDTPWVRVEVRAGVGPLCVLLCGACL